MRAAQRVRIGKWRGPPAFAPENLLGEDICFSLPLPDAFGDAQHRRCSFKMRGGKPVLDNEPLANRGPAFDTIVLVKNNN
jgi:hypothetical protein